METATQNKPATEAQRVTTVQPTLDPDFQRLIQQDYSAGVFEDPNIFAHAQRVAKLLVSSHLVPDHFKGEANIGSAVIAVDMAFRLKFNPLLVMQHLYVVHGKPGFSAQFVIAAVNASGHFSRLAFEFTGEGEKRQCVAVATHLRTGKELRSTPINIDLAKKEGWMQKNGSKWQSMPDQMLLYRSASFWARAYAPELTMGMPTVEELKDNNDPLAPDFTPRNGAGTVAPLFQDPQKAAESPQPDAPSDQEPVTKETKPGPKPASGHTNYPKAIRGLLKLSKIEEKDFLAFCASQAEDSDFKLDDSVSLEEASFVAVSTLQNIHDNWEAFQAGLKKWKGAK